MNSLLIEETKTVQASFKNMAWRCTAGAVLFAFIALTTDIAWMAAVTTFGAGGATMGSVIAFRVSTLLGRDIQELQQ